MKTRDFDSKEAADDFADELRREGHDTVSVDILVRGGPYVVSWSDESDAL